MREAARRPVVLGVNGPQGGGKTTLARLLVERWAGMGLRAVAVSVDDFYLTNAAQKALAAANPGNPYLQKRGYPGTHDVALGVATLDALANAKRGDMVKVPQYDKSALGGEGDRGGFREVVGPVDVVVFEGWMLGFRPVSGVSEPHLRVVNEKLAAYDAWNHRLNAMVQMVLSRRDDVVRWRVEAEERMKATGKAGMSTADVTAYITSFLPAYDLYPAQLASDPITPGRHLVVTLGADRSPRLFSQIN